MPWVLLVKEKRIDGDRYAEGRGHLTNKIDELGLRDQRHVTFFEEETLDWLRSVHQIDLQPSEHRRNVTTRGVPLNHLFGKTFGMGQTLLLGFETSPCKHLDEVTGKAMVHLLINRAGLNARILHGGRVDVGDVIEIVST